jgi:glycogen synthase
VLKDNIAGDAAALIRKRIFDLGYEYSPDLTSYEDWQLYRELHSVGLYGRVIPERLLLYRVRDTSMLRDVGLDQVGRLFGEMNAHLREKEVAWESKSA